MKFLQIIGLGLALVAPLASARFLTDEQIKAQFTPSDLNNDGSVCFDELEAATRKQLKQFEDPYISKEQMTMFVRDIVNSILQSDTDKNGALSFDEFATMMRQEYAHNQQRKRLHDEKQAQQQAAQKQESEQQQTPQQVVATSKEHTETGDVVLVEDELEADQAAQVKDTEL